MASSRHSNSVLLLLLAPARAAHGMEQGIAEKPWIDLHASLRADSEQLYTPPHSLASLIDDLTQSPQPSRSTTSVATRKPKQAARAHFTVPASTSQPPYPSSAVFHCKFAFDAGGYLLLVSDWVRVWCHRATAEQVQQEKAEFAAQVSLSTAEEAITRLIQPLLTGPQAKRLHRVSFRAAATSDAATEEDGESAQAALVLDSEMEVGVFRVQWQFECRPFLTPLHQSSLLLHLTLLPQQSMVSQLHAQLTAAKSSAQDGGTRVKAEVKASGGGQEGNGAGRVALSQGRSQQVAASQQAPARSPPPIASPPAAGVVKSEEAAVPTLESLYEASMRASQSQQSQSQPDEAADTGAAQVQADEEERKEAQRGADGEGYWDEAKLEWVQGEKERERAEKAKQSVPRHNTATRPR